MAGGAGIMWRALATVGTERPIPGVLGVVVLVVAIAVRSAMATRKFRVARRLGSLALRSDAWNDAVDILSAAVALAAVLLSRLLPGTFADADRYGAAAVGLVVVLTGTRVARAATLDLADTMPDRAKLDAVRRIALSVAGVEAVEKQHARKTGLHYHIDLHVEVDPDMTVRDSHRIAHEVQNAVRGQLTWVADVLVHVEPAGGVGGPRRL
jgi:cation diffusion facilitator family transporter